MPYNSVQKSFCGHTDSLITCFWNKQPYQVMKESSEIALPRTKGLRDVLL